MCLVQDCSAEGGDHSTSVFDIGNDLDVVAEGLLLQFEIVILLQFGMNPSNKREKMVQGQIPIGGRPDDKCTQAVKRLPLTELQHFHNTSGMSLPGTVSIESLENGTAIQHTMRRTHSTSDFRALNIDRPR